jgi:hypothetical protein
VNKVCKSCGVEMPLDEFHNHPKTRDGKNAKCKACVNQARRENYHLKGGKDQKALYYAEHRQEILTRAKSSWAEKKISSTDSIKATKQRYEARHVKKAFSLSEEEINLVNDYGESKGLASFAAAFCGIVQEAFGSRDFLNLNTFDWAVSYLMENRRQIAAVHQNLKQLNSLFETGRVPDFESNLDNLTSLRSKCVAIRSDLHRLIIKIQSNAP